MAGVPGQRGRLVPQGLDRSRATRPPRAARPRRSCVTARPASSARPPGTRRSTSFADRLRELQRRARRRRGGCLRGRGAHQREGLPARQVRPGRARHQPDRLQRPLVHVVGGVGRPTARSASTAGCRSRSPTSSRPTSLVLVGSNLAETMPPAARHLDRLRAHGGTARRRWILGAPPTADRADLFLQPVPGTDLRARARRCCTCSTQPAPSTRSTSPTRTTGWDEVRALGRRLVAGAGRAGDRASPCRAA